MKYKTTKLHQLKSYPTYQFYAKVDSKKYNIDEVFRICILETLKWLRNRLSNFDEMPECLSSPEPGDLALFTEDMLHSFSFMDGPQIEVIYVEKNGVWSIRIIEPDMGTNHGTENERKAVSGRSFITEISFHKQTEYVEAGMRTICSEPTDVTDECEVFRLALVKALAFSNDLRLIHGGVVINGTPMIINSKTEFERFISVFNDPSRSMPILMIADTETVAEKPVIPDQNEKLIPSASDTLLSRTALKNNDINITISADIDIKKSFTTQSDRKKDKKRSSDKKPFAKPVYVKLPEADSEKIAKKLVGFAIVVFVKEDFFRQLQNKLRISLKYGEVIIIRHQEQAEHILYDTYKNDIQGFPNVLYKEINESHKRCGYKFGDILFHSDAKLKDLHNKRHQTDSLEEQCGFYKQENAELKQKIKALNEQHTDMEQSAEQVRTLNKNVEALQTKLEEKTGAFDALKEEYLEKEDAYRRSADILQFYREYIELAEKFPTDKNKICEWAEKCFGDNIIISSRARNEMKKCNCSLDTGCLCDGIVYLDAYSRYRRNELSKEVLDRYSERKHWEVTGCGKETLKMRSKDYTTTVNGKTYLLDQHIKQGIHAEVLIRIYFCWDDASKKIIIGSMPEHLPTVKNGT